MQIISYDANLSLFFIFYFFYGWIYNLYDYSTKKIIISVFFALNLKICRILRFTIRSYDLRSHLPSMILRRILILIILIVWAIISYWTIKVWRIPYKKKKKFDIPKSRRSKWSNTWTFLFLLKQTHDYSYSPHAPKV